MAEQRGRGRPPKLYKIDEENEVGSMRESSEESVVELASMDTASASSESQQARWNLRSRWELASVLNFLHVFQPIIKSDLEISAEEIETGLIAPNNTLAKLHIGLLKGIPPISKSLTTSDVWVTVLCKKLALWWPWVAEGDIPLVAAHGEEISRYKELDPTIRLLILKALCEIRAEQDDTLRYIVDTLKHGDGISTFRKDRIGGDGNGTAYWFDGDSIIGHRLYKEVNKVEPKQKLKGKGRLTQPLVSFQWETLATNLEEFQEISDKLSSSGNMVESGVGKTVKNDIIPVLENLQKKKERALKRQQRQTIGLNSFLSSHFENGRSRRDRKPVSYTFDEYDRSIDEAIQISKKGKTSHDQNNEGKLGESSTDHNVTSSGDLDSDTELPHSSSQSDYEMENKNHKNLLENKKSDDGDDDADYRDNEDDDEDEDDDDDEEGDSDGGGDIKLGNSSKENGNFGRRTSSRHSKKWKDLQESGVVLRRSNRTAANTSHKKDDMTDSESEEHEDMAKTVQSPSMDNKVPGAIAISDSEDCTMNTNVRQFIDLNEAIPADGIDCSDDGDETFQTGREEEKDYNGAH